MVTKLILERRGLLICRTKLVHEHDCINITTGYNFLDFSGNLLCTFLKKYFKTTYVKVVISKQCLIELGGGGNFVTKLFVIAICSNKQIDTPRKTFRLLKIFKQSSSRKITIRFCAMTRLANKYFALSHVGKIQTQSCCWSTRKENWKLTLCIFPPRFSKRCLVLECKSKYFLIFCLSHLKNIKSLSGILSSCF